MKPHLTKYMMWIDLVHLTESSCFIYGPFTFDSHTNIISAKQLVALQHWDFLLTSYIVLSIVPPPFILLLIQNQRRREKRRNMCSVIFIVCIYIGPSSIPSSYPSHVPRIFPNRISNKDPKS